MTYYTVYKTTNKINGKFYIGTHKTKNLNDDYMGSGKYLKRSIEKHGIENFSKEILFVYDNPEEMFAKEAELVNEDFLAEENTYNLKIGGMGGFDYINENGLNANDVNRSPEHFERFRKAGSERLIELIKTDPKYKAIYQKNADICREKTKITHPNGTFYGKTHTDEAKRKISLAASKHQSGSKNSQYGTMWITDGNKNIKIKKDGVIPIGWSRGSYFGGKVGKKIKCRLCEKEFLRKAKEKYCSKNCRSTGLNWRYPRRYQIKELYESGTDIKEICDEFDWKGEQSLVRFLNMHFPNRRRFKPKERTYQQLKIT